MKENTAIRLKQLMSEYGLRQVDIVEKCQPYCRQFNSKMSKSDISQYLKGKVEPSQLKLTILGLALNVSEAWLMGYDVPRERATYDEIYLTSDERELINALRSLPPQEQGTALKLLCSALKNV